MTYSGLSSARRRYSAAVALGDDTFFVLVGPRGPWVGADTPDEILDRPRRFSPDHEHLTIRCGRPAGPQHSPQAPSVMLPTLVDAWV